MKKLKFSDLDGENKLTAVSQMLHFNKKYNWPNGSIWDSEEDVQTDLENDYDPDEHFSFYINEFEEVQIKIG